MRILICGGRDFCDWDVLSEALEPYRYQGDFWIFGDAKGADCLAKAWVKTIYRDRFWENHCKEYKADWATHGKAAGPIRNQQMLDEGKPDLVIAFPGGKGTAHMVKIAKEAGVKVIEV